MLQIGEFARLSRISVRMLRHYDRHGLLRPAKQDGQTGYRRYTVSQLAAANCITTLRDLGFTVREIKRLVNADAVELARAVRERGKRIEEDIAREERRLAELRRFEQEVEHGDSGFGCEVSLVAVPAYQVVSCRMELERYDEERLAWEALGAFMQEKGIAPSEPYTEFCTFCDEGGEDERDSTGAHGRVLVEVAVATDGVGSDEGVFRFYRSDPLPQAASIMVYGSYENIAPVYASFARWLEKHPSLCMAGPTREVAHFGPWNADDPQDYLTEFLVPVTARV